MTFDPFQNPSDIVFDRGLAGGRGLYITKLSRHQNHMFSLEGVVTALVTPFQKDGSISRKVLRPLLELQREAHVNGVFVCGTTGEWPLLDSGERKLLAEAVTETAPTGLEIILQVGGHNLFQTLELARHAVDVGAQAIAVVTPIYYAHDEPALLRYFRTVAASVDCPIFLYNIPQRTGNNLSPQILGKLFRTHSNIVGMKNSTLDFEHLRATITISSSGRIVLSGHENFMLPGLAIGSRGAVSASANAFPELFVTLYRRFREGRIEEASRIQKTIASMKDSLSTQTIAAIKEALRLRGIDVGLPRPPMRSLTQGERLRVRRLVKRLDVL